MISLCGEKEKAAKYAAFSKKRRKGKEEKRRPN
jgi:hypothetical protein